MKCWHNIIPRLLLKNQMGLDKELDAQPQSTGRHIVHLLADAVSQIQPQVLSFAACELQPKVVHFNYAQLSANLERDERNLVAKVDGGKGSAVWAQLWGNGKSRQGEALRDILFIYSGRLHCEKGQLTYWVLSGLHGVTKERSSLDVLVHPNLAGGFKKCIIYTHYLY